MSTLSSFIADMIQMTCLLFVNGWVHLEGLQGAVQKSSSEFLGSELGHTRAASPSLSAKILSPFYISAFMFKTVSE